MFGCGISFADYVNNAAVHSLPRPAGGGGGGYSLIWPILGCAAGQGMVFVLAVLNRVYNLARVCPKQGIPFRACLS